MDFMRRQRQRSFDINTTVHGSCPECHHFHGASPIQLHFSRRGSHSNMVACQRCGRVCMVFGGLVPRESMASQETLHGFRRVSILGFHRRSSSAPHRQMERVFFTPGAQIHEEPSSSDGPIRSQLHVENYDDGQPESSGTRTAVVESVNGDHHTDVPQSTSANTQQGNTPAQETQPMTWRRKIFRSPKILPVLVAAIKRKTGRVVAKARTSKIISKKSSRKGKQPSRADNQETEVPNRTSPHIRDDSKQETLCELCVDCQKSLQQHRAQKTEERARQRQEEARDHCPAHCCVWARQVGSGPRQSFRGSHESDASTILVDEAADAPLEFSPIANVTDHARGGRHDSDGEEEGDRPRRLSFTERLSVSSTIDGHAYPDPPPISEEYTSYSSMVQQEVQQQDFAVITS